MRSDVKVRFLKFRQYFPQLQADIAKNSADAMVNTDFHGIRHGFPQCCVFRCFVCVICVYCDVVHRRVSISFLVGRAVAGFS